MGLLEPSDWTGQWIGSDQFAERVPHQIWESKQTTTNPIVDPWMRRSLVLDEQPQRAVLYVASVGYHELYVNGKRIGDDVLTRARKESIRP
jgi:alpha-L-rhamnosidase